MLLLAHAKPKARQGSFPANCICENTLDYQKASGAVASQRCVNMFRMSKSLFVDAIKWSLGNIMIFIARFLRGRFPCLPHSHRAKGTPIGAVGPDDPQLERGGEKM